MQEIVSQGASGLVTSQVPSQDESINILTFSPTPRLHFLKLYL